MAGRLKGTPEYVAEILKMNAKEIKDYCDNAKTCRDCPFRAEPFECRIKEPCKWELENE